MQQKTMQACSECTINATTSLILQVGQVLRSFVFERANISGKLDFPSFLNLGLNEQYLNNQFRKCFRSTCLHFHFDSLSQTFPRTDIHLRESLLQMCNKGSYRLKYTIECSLQDLKVAVADMHLWALKGKQI